MVGIFPNEDAIIRLVGAILLERCGVGRTKFYELIAAGAIKAVKLGSKTLIDVAVADAYFDGLPKTRDTVANSLAPAGN